MSHSQSPLSPHLKKPKPLQRKVILVLAASIAMMSLWQAPVNTMTIEEAYETIPHRQTTFNPETAKMGYEERAYLTQSFQLLDEAMAARVSVLIWLNQGGDEGQEGRSPEQYERMIVHILSEMGRLQVPQGLKRFHRLVNTAIKEQRRYLISLEPSDQFNVSHPLVQQSHRKLIQAYQILIRMYPQELPHNQNAFFDHLCALDFI